MSRSVFRAGMSHRRRLLAVLASLAIAALVCGLLAAYLLTCETRPGNATASRPGWSSFSATPTTGATASANPSAESTYQTPTGLRFADETTSELALEAAQTLSQEDEALTRFVRGYAMTLWIDSGTPSSYAQAYAAWDYLDESDARALKTFGAIFIDEWAKYPKPWVRVSGITTIALVKDLVVSGIARSAMPDPVGKTLFLDVDAADSRPADDYDYARGAIHHEFDHLIEFNLFGTYTRDDPEWTSHNPNAFRYGNGGISWYQGSPQANTPHPQDGFVDAYATAGIEEDKAETYAYLFVHRRYALLQSWMQTDPLLAAKVADYEALIESYVPLMNDAYFAAIHP